MELKGIMLKWNKSYRERQILYDLTYMWNLKKQNPKNQPHRYREQISGCQRCGGGGEMGKGSQKEQAPSSKINKSYT